jgi:energy-converting hydrogenase Eha subunit A
MPHPARTTPPFHYPRPVPLAACPFCRELFETGEASHCPTCGIALASLAKLPPSPTLRDEPDEWHQDLGPEHDRLPWNYFGRGRGPLLVLCVVGLLLFLLPWIDVSVPYEVRLSGWDLARKMGWSWGAFASWIVLAPTVGSRRSIVALRGARVAAGFLALVPAVTTAILLSFPQRSSALLPIRFHYDPALYATLVVSLVATAVAVRLGGRVDVLEARKGSSAGQILH